MEARITEIARSGYSGMPVGDDPAPVVIDGSILYFEIDTGDQLSVRVDKTPDELEAMAPAAITALVTAAYADQLPTRLAHPAIGLSFTVPSGSPVSPPGDPLTVPEA